MSVLLVLALSSLGARTVPAGGVAAASREQRVRFEQRSQPTVSVLGVELKSFARKSSAPSALDLLNPEDWTFSPDPPRRSTRAEAVAASQPAALELGPSRTRAPPAVL